MRGYASKCGRLDAISSDCARDPGMNPSISNGDPAAITPAGYRGRFAPSPTGDLHFGSLLTAFGSWLMARNAGGEWWVRIEDLDPPREVAGAAGRQLAALAAFGLWPDAPVVRQSERHALYQAAVDRLLAADLAFVCHCSRHDLEAAGGVHRRCIASAPRSDPSIRLRVEDGTWIGFVDALQGPSAQDVSREVGDFVLRRTDGHWAYQLAVVVDDAAQGITDVVRGADLLASTPRQMVLQRALGLPTPRHAHLPLVLDAEGRKLSKSDAARPVDPRDPVPALRRAWEVLGQDPRALAPLRELPAVAAAALGSFDPGRIPGSPAVIADPAALHNSPFTIVQ